MANRSATWAREVKCGRSQPALAQSLKLIGSPPDEEFILGQHVAEKRLPVAVAGEFGGGERHGVHFPAESVRRAAQAWGEGAQAGGPAPSASAYAAGPVSGFGSVIVNGVRYDDSAALVQDDDGAPSSRDRLKLGWMVEVEAAAVDRAAGTGRALRIRFGGARRPPSGSGDDDPAQRARHQRFLAARGFSADAIRQALRDAGAD